MLQLHLHKDPIFLPEYEKQKSAHYLSYYLPALMKYLVNLTQHLVQILHLALKKALSMKMRTDKNQPEVKVP